MRSGDAAVRVSACSCAALGLWRHAIPAPLCTAWFRWILQETMMRCNTSANLHSVFPADFTGNNDHAWKQYFQPQFHTSYAHNTFNLLLNMVLAVMTCWANLTRLLKRVREMGGVSGGALAIAIPTRTKLWDYAQLAEMQSNALFTFLNFSTKLPAC